MKIVIGLGNPGEKYKYTRHNVGFMAVEALADKAGASWTVNKKVAAQIAKSGDTIFVKPLTFMNESGRAISAILDYFGITEKKLGLFRKKSCDFSELLTVIHDDSDQVVGKSKTVGESGNAGHHGLDSIVKHLRTKNFRRIKIGIRPENLTHEALGHHVKAEEFVLKRFSKDEQEKIDELIKNLSL